MTSNSPLTFAQATGKVARREIVTRLRDRSFLISTGITLLILGVVMVLPKLLGSDDPARVAFGGPQAATVATATLAQAKQLDLKVEQKNYPSESAAREALKSGDLNAYVTGDSIVVQEKIEPQLEGILQNAHRQAAAAENLAKEDIDPAKVAAASNVPALAVDAVDPVDKNAEARGQIAFIGSLVLYGQLIGYCMWVAFGVVEEKSSRVVEIILSAVSSKALLAGKILGIGLLGFLQLLLIAVGAVTLGSATGMMSINADMLVPIGFVLAWFVLGYAFFSSLFAATAARVSRQEELQNVIGPLNMLVMASFFATFYVNANPEAVFSRILGVLPPFSALASPVRLAKGDAPWWEVGLAVGLMLVAILVLVRVGGRIYDGAVLRMGAKVSWKDAWSSAKPAVKA